MNKLKILLGVAIGLLVTVAFAQQQTPYVAPPWTYKTKQLKRTEIDALLAKPEQVVLIDVRRPDELIAKGSFPVFLSIQIKDLEKGLAYIPKDRKIITVSNRAHRAGAAGDLLTEKGFLVAGAAGSLDYEDEGGSVTRIAAPPPKTSEVLPSR